MFGYIKAFKPELRIKEWEMYKAVYCALCRELGRDYGLLARMTLSYDFTFLALLKMSLNDSGCEAERKCCAFNPLKKCNYCKTEGDELEFSAAAAMIMLYYKLLDNINDEKGIGRIKYSFLKPTFKRAYNKAKQKYPFVADIFSDYIKKQGELEKENCKNIDAAAEPTAIMLASLFESCSENQNDKRALSRMGYCMGRYIYILDAAADYEGDIKKGRYNPFQELDKERVKSLLEISINEACAAFELLNIYKLKNILGNIIYLGLEDTYKKELSK